MTCGSVNGLCTAIPWRAATWMSARAVRPTAWIDSTETRVPASGHDVRTGPLPPAVASSRAAGVAQAGLADASGGAGPRRTVSFAAVASIGNTAVRRSRAQPIA